MDSNEELKSEFEYGGWKVDEFDFKFVPYSHDDLADGTTYHPLVVSSSGELEYLKSKILTSTMFSYALLHFKKTGKYPNTVYSSGLIKHFDLPNDGGAYGFTLKFAKE